MLGCHIKNWDRDPISLDFMCWGAIFINGSPHLLQSPSSTVPIFYGEDETAASSNLSSGNGLLPTKRKAVVP